MQRYSCLDWVAKHPVSIQRLNGFFPKTWRQLATDEDAAMGAPKMLEYIRERRNDPDSWLVIPDFGTKPESVSYRGFDIPLGWPCCLDEELRSALRMTRMLAQRAFPSLKKLWRVADGLEESDSKDHASYYDHIIFSLGSVINEELDADERRQHALAAAAALSEWALGESKGVLGKRGLKALLR